MKFFTCVSGKYRELAPLYEFCVKRVYPNAKVEIRKEPANPACKRFLIDPGGEYVHVTDVDIFLLPHKKTHKEYYSQFEVNGACYLRGATVAQGRHWQGNDARICGGHIGFFRKYYKNTVLLRDYWKANIPIGREQDEVILQKILTDANYPIPEKPYTFPDGNAWDWEYRDLHLGDFRSNKYLKWKPDKEKVRDLIEDPDFRALTVDLSPSWRDLIHKIQQYCL